MRSVLKEVNTNQQCREAKPQKNIAWESSKHDAGDAHTGKHFPLIPLEAGTEKRGNAGPQDQDGVGREIRELGDALSAIVLQSPNDCSQLPPQPPGPTTVAEMTACVEEVFKDLAEQGVTIVNAQACLLGRELGKGAFGTVRLGTCALSNISTAVAVKTIIACGEEFREKLESFKTEATVGWAASKAAREGKKSRICITLGACFEVVLGL